MALIVFNFFNLNATNWREAAKSDLNFIYNTLKEDHPGYYNPKDSEFCDLLENSYRKSCDKLYEVSSFYDYAKLMCFFINKFEDVHLKVVLNYEKHLVEWPGFIVKYLNGGFFIFDVDDNCSPKKLLSWNGFSPEKYLKDFVIPDKEGGSELPRIGNPDIFASKVLSAPYMGIWDYNPWVEKPSYCIVENNGKKETINLEWQTIKRKKLMQKITFTLWGKRNSINTKKIDPKKVWISLPTFAPQSSDECNAIKNIVNEMKSIKNAELIIFDLRGNRGGNLQWGIDILHTLFGPEYYHSQINKTFEKIDKGVFWRASRNNLNSIKKSFISCLEQKVSSSMIDWFKKVVNGIESAIKHNKNYYFEEKQTFFVNQFSSHQALVNPVRAKIVVITDSLNASASLSFMDLLKILTPIFQIGWPTSADTNYSEIQVQNFPSGLGSIYFPMKYYINRMRLPNTPYNPDYLWPCEIKNITPSNKEFLKIIDKI